MIQVELQILSQRRMTYILTGWLFICGMNATTHYAVLSGALGFIAAGWPDTRLEPNWPPRKVVAYVNDIALSGLAAYAMVLSIATYAAGFALRSMFS